MTPRTVWRKTRQVVDLFRKANTGIGLRSKFQAAFYITVHRGSVKSLQPLLKRVHDAICGTARDTICLRFRLRGVRRQLFLRINNFGDYCVAGELLDGIYQAPEFTVSDVYDCGANIGIFSLLAATVFPNARLHCYEPDEENVQMLRKNLASNGVEADIRPVGVWKKRCTLFYHPGNSVTGRVLEEQSAFPIPVEPLEITRPDVWVKLDIEGAEYVVLPELLSRDPLPHYMSVELHFFNVSGADIISALKSKGYALRGFIDPACPCAVFDACLKEERTGVLAGFAKSGR